MERTTVQHSPNNLVSRILQVALGLFVTTSDLPSLPLNHELLSYDCSFDSDCRWTSVGDTMDRWRIARGEPDSLLWLAATGTMQLPREPFVLIEQRGNPVDALMTDAIRCQKGYADFSFTYWAIGNADLEICLTDLDGHKFNCTGMLNSHVMPGKVSLKIPELQRSFRIMISPNGQPGVIVLDDIRYDASICPTAPVWPAVRGRPDFLSTPAPKKISPWTLKKTSGEVTDPPLRRIPPTTSTEIATTTTTTTTFSTTDIAPTTTTEDDLIGPSQPNEVPFDLMIHGNKTKPLFDRRVGSMVKEATKLLCDFNSDFACQWGVEAGRWAIIEKGAIPTLEDSIADPSLLPTYPAALVLQGTAMLTSDPILCQSGAGKLLFRYWSNGDILLQVCALGYKNDSEIIHCVDQSRTMRHERNTLAVFELTRPIAEPFTLNIVPQWEIGLKNRFLVMDEIAYIGECIGDTTERHTTPTEAPLILPVAVTTHSILTTTTHVPTTPTTRAPTTTTTRTTTEEDTSETATDLSSGEITEETEEPLTTTVTRNKFTSKLATKKRPYTRIIPTTFSPVFPEASTLKPHTTRGRPGNKWFLLTTTPEPRSDDYCDLLNCNFDDTACNYLNHGLTKKPWTLRNRGYGYPLTGSTDIRATTTNGQFVSSILDPGDIAILESPKFNATKSLNVLLFQYYRPSQMTTIRLCLGSRYTNPLRTVSSFMQCPSILRSVTSKNAFRWNTVHVQLPPGTTHFYLVAHNSERADGRAAMALDNMRVAICDTRGFAPDYVEDNNEFQEFLQLT